MLGSSSTRTMADVHKPTQFRHRCTAVTTISLRLLAYLAPRNILGPSVINLQTSKYLLQWLKCAMQINNKAIVDSILRPRCALPSPFLADNAFSTGKKTPSRRQAMRPIVYMSEKDRATDIGNMHKNLVKIARQTDTQTHRQTYSWQYFATAPAGEVNICR